MFEKKLTEKAFKVFLEELGMRDRSEGNFLYFSTSEDRDGVINVLDNRIEALAEALGYHFERREAGGYIAIKNK